MYEWGEHMFCYDVVASFGFPPAVRAVFTLVKYERQGLGLEGGGPIALRRLSSQSLSRITRRSLKIAMRVLIGPETQR